MLAFGLIASMANILTKGNEYDFLLSALPLYSRVSGMLPVGAFIACLVVAIFDQKGLLPNSPTGLLERVAITGEV